MMKCVFALVALLHICYTVKSTVEVKTEIIKKLEQLNVSYREKKINMTPVDVMRVPSPRMIKHPSRCVGVFIRELKQILNNVTVVESNSQDTVTAILANLDTLGQHEENDNICNMTQRPVSLTPFKPYANFLRKLNS